MERRIPNTDFFVMVEQEIAAGSNVTIPVNGTSMHPLIRNGKDKVVLSPFEESDLGIGIIFLFRYKGRHIMHRIVGKNGDTFIMQGDGNCIRTFETAQKEDMVALVGHIIKPNGRILDCRSRKWLHIFRLWSRLNPLRRYIMAFDRRILGNR